MASVVRKAYQDFGMRVAQWAMQAQQGRPGDIEEIGRRYAMGRAAIESVLDEAMAMLQRSENPDAN